MNFDNGSLSVPLGSSSSLTLDSSSPVANEAISRIRSREAQRADLIRMYQSDSMSWQSDRTMKAYIPRIREYLEYCDELDIGYAISQTSLETFICSRVVGRRMRAKGNQIATEFVGVSTVCGYISSLVKLWELQTKFKTNNHPKPRLMASKSEKDGSVKIFVPTSKGHTGKKKRKFGDLQRAAPMDGSAMFGKKRKEEMLLQKKEALSLSVPQPPQLVVRPVVELFQKSLSVSLMEVHSLRSALATNPKMAYETAMKWIRESNLTPFTMEALDAIIQPMRAHEVMSAIMTLLLDSILLDKNLMISLVHELLTSPHTQMDWVLPYLLTRPEAMRKVLGQVHDFMITFFVMRGQVQIVGNTSIRTGQNTRIMYICQCFKYAMHHADAGALGTSAKWAIAESLTEIFNVYLDGLLQSRKHSFPQASFGRHVLVYILALLQLCPILFQDIGAYFVQFLGRKNLALIHVLEHLNEFSLHKTPQGFQAVSLVDSLWSQLINLNTLPYLFPFLGEFLLLLDECQQQLLTETVKDAEGLDTALFGAPFGNITTYLLNMLKVNAATQDVTKLWFDSFQRHIPTFVEKWWSRLLSKPDNIECLETCLMICGTFSSEEACFEVINSILFSPSGFTDSKKNLIGLMDFFLASAMHLFSTFECRFPGILRKAIESSLKSLKNQLPQALMSTMLCLHLILQFEEKSQLSSMRDTLSERENWKQLFMYGAHKDKAVALTAINLVLDVNPHSFTLGMAYFILESSTRRLYELCRDCSQPSIEHDALEQAFIRLIIKICQDHSCGDVLVDFMIDSFCYVFSNPDVSTVPVKTAFGVVNVLVTECLQKKILSPMEIAEQLSRKIAHYIPRDVARSKRRHSENEVLYPFERVPIIWEMLLLVSSDAETRHYVVHFIQPQASILTDWWNGMKIQSSIASKFPYHLEATLYILRIYSKTSCISEPDSQIYFLFERLLGSEIARIMAAYCPFVESAFGLQQIGQRDEWLENRIKRPVAEWIKDWMIEGKISEDEAVFFLKDE